MATINMASILNKAQKRMKQPDMVKQINKKIDDVVMGRALPKKGSVIIAGGEEAAEKFIEILRKEIQNLSGVDPSNGGLGATAVSALVDLDNGAPEKLGMGKYKIGIWFNGDLSRKSLSPNKYEDIDNIAALLNSGYSAGHKVHGVWEGHTDSAIASRTSRGGAHFIENAVREYMAGYSKNYGVIDVKLAPDYN